MHHGNLMKVAALVTLATSLPTVAFAQLGSTIPNPTKMKASHVVCTALETLRATYGADAPRCQVQTTNETYYHGSMPIDGSLRDLLVMPYVTSGAYYCSIADAHNAQASATTNALGKFGIESKLRVSRDPATMTLKGERLGTLWLFGAGLTIEAQDFEWAFRAETTGTPRQWGGYMTVKSEGVGLDWDPPGVVIPVPVPVGFASIGLDFMLFLRNPYERLKNNALLPTVHTDFSYAAWQQCPTRCTSLPSAPICDCNAGLRLVPASKFIADHQRNCSGACTSLSDGVLPYLGPYGGASGRDADYMYADPFANWFQIGRASPRTLVQWLRTDVSGGLQRTQVPFNINTDASIGTLKTHATSGGNLTVLGTYELPMIKTDLLLSATFAFRDGFSVQQQDEARTSDAGAQIEQVRVWSDIDAEAAVDVDLALVVDLRFPIFDPPPVTVTVPNLYKSEWHGRPSQLPTEIIYDAAADGSGYSRFTSYKVKGAAKTDPDSSRFQCIQAPKTTLNPGALTSADDFVRNVGTNLINSIHPCDFTFCANGKTYTYEWDAARKTMDTSDPGRPGCFVCEDILTFCDASNQPIMRDVLDASGNPIRGTDGQIIRQALSAVIDSNREENPPGHCLR